MLRPEVIAAVRSQVFLKTVKTFPVVDNLTPEEVYYIQSLGGDISFLGAICQFILKTQRYLKWVQSQSHFLFYEHPSFFAWFSGSHLRGTLNLIPKADSWERNYIVEIPNPQEDPLAASLRRLGSDRPPCPLSLTNTSLFVFPASWLDAIRLACVLHVSNPSLQGSPVDITSFLLSSEDTLKALSAYVYEQRLF